MRRQRKGVVNAMEIEDANDVESQERFHSDEVVKGAQSSEVVTSS
jgi:hypothetical protein